jgi:vesicle coat complex subunit
MSVGLLVPEKSRGTSSPTSVAYHSSPVSLVCAGLRRSCHVVLPGLSDPIYCEAYVKMQGFDIVLGQSCCTFLVLRDRILSLSRSADVLLVNQTASTLQNLSLDFATLGDLKLVERPAVYTIAPHGFQTIKATIKVMRSGLRIMARMDPWLTRNTRCHLLRQVSSSVAFSGRAQACLKHA